MPSYAFKARNGAGELIRGSIAAVTEAQVLKELEARGVYAVDVRLSGKQVSGFLTRLGAHRNRIKLDEKILFIRQFEAMLRAGVPLTTSLHAIADQADNEFLARILTETRNDIEGGSTLAQALRRHPALLTPIQVSLVDAGEQGGILDDILTRLGELLEYEAETRARVREATFYPAMVVGELFLALIVVIRFVFPRFKALFGSHGAALPLPTRIMIGLSDFAEAYWWHSIIGGVLLALAFNVWRKTDKGKRIIDGTALKVPVFGEIILMILMSRFARVLATLLESGIPFLRSLAIVEKTIDNKIIQEEISGMAFGIQKGQSIAESIRSDGIIPSAVRKMIDVGERSGSVSDMLLRISAFYDRQVDYRIKNLTTVIEPLLLVVLGVSVLFVALAVFMPMWDMSRVIMGN